MLIAMTLLSPQALHHAKSIKRAAVAVISIVQVPMTVMTMILKILIVFQLLVVRITRLNQVIQLTNNQLLTLPQLRNKTNHRRKNTMIKATANNNQIVSNHQVIIQEHNLPKAIKIITHNRVRNLLHLKIININLE